MVSKLPGPPSIFEHDCNAYCDGNVHAKVLYTHLADGETRSVEEITLASLAAEGLELVRVEEATEASPLGAISILKGFNPDTGERFVTAHPNQRYVAALVYWRDPHEAVPEKPPEDGWEEVEVAWKE